MGAIGFDTMCADVKLRMGNRSDIQPYNVTTNPSGNSAGIDWYQLWVNRAYRHICGAKNLFGINAKVIIPELETKTTVATVASTATIAVPPLYSIIRHVYDATNNFRLRFIPESTYLNYTDRTTTSAYGKPNQWCRMGEYIYLHPTPDAAYNMDIYYKYVPADLSGSSTTVISPIWDEPITMLATYKGMMDMGELDRAKEIKNALISMLTDVIPAAHAEEIDRKEWLRPDEAHLMYLQDYD